VDLFDELVRLAAALHDAGTPYGLCGGLAVAAHGAPRATKDIDLHDVERLEGDDR
jgi:hypothetical protein